MGTIVDEKTSLSTFNNGSTKTIKEEELPRYNLIKWCQQFLDKDSNFIDVGANYGSYSVLLGKKCQKVYAFEPYPKFFECLKDNIETNQINAECHQIGLGSKNKNNYLHTLSNNAHTLMPFAYQGSDVDIKFSEEVEIRKLDSFEIKDVDFIKISVEGYEYQVLQGMKETLQENDFPPMMIKIWNNEWYNKERERTFNFLKNIGYKIHPVSGTDHYYLASDHILRFKQIKSTEPKVTKTKNDWETIMEKLDISTLLLYHQEDLISAEICQCEEKDFWIVWYKLALHYRCKGENQLSYNCAMEGLPIAPEERKYLFYQELSIVSFYINKKKEGFDACEKIVLDHRLSWNIRDTTMANEAFYMQNLPMIATMSIKHPTTHEYHESSSSLIQTANGYRLNIRKVNYQIGPHGNYLIADPNNIVRTKNYLIEFDKNLQKLSDCELIDQSGVRLYPKDILGMEDLRLFNDNYFFCTYLELNEGRIPQIGWGTYDSNTGVVTRMVGLTVKKELQCEKNWLPFMMEGEIYFIYAMGPLRIYHVNQETGEVSFYKEIKYSSIDEFGLSAESDFRGSAPPIKYNGGWLWTIHQVQHSNPRKYFDRFVWSSNDFSEMHYSRPFYFEKVGIEFNLSVCQSHTDEKELLITYSVNDGSSIIAKVDCKILNQMLKYKMFHIV